MLFWLILQQKHLLPELQYILFLFMFFLWFFLLLGLRFCVQAKSSVHSPHVLHSYLSSRHNKTIIHTDDVDTNLEFGRTSGRRTSSENHIMIGWLRKCVKDLPLKVRDGWINVLELWNWFLNKQFKFIKIYSATANTGGSTISRWWAWMRYGLISLWHTISWLWTKIKNISDFP